MTQWLTPCLFPLISSKCGEIYIRFCCFYFLTTSHAPPPESPATGVAPVQPLRVTSVSRLRGSSECQSPHTFPPAVLPEGGVGPCPAQTAANARAQAHAHTCTHVRTYAHVYTHHAFWEDRFGALSPCLSLTCPPAIWRVFLCPSESSELAGREVKDRTERGPAGEPPAGPGREPGRGVCPLCTAVSA